MLTKHVYSCPDCKRPHVFALYLREDGTPYGEKVGRCNRQNNCGYDYRPAAYCEDLRRSGQSLPPLASTTPATPPPPTYISDEAAAELRQLIAARRGSGDLFRYVASLFGAEVTSKAFDLYATTSDKHGRTIYFYVDSAGRFIDGKVMAYKADGHRDKQRPPYGLYNSIWKKPTTPPPFRIDEAAARPPYPLFGAHLLGVPSLAGRDVVIVESEKTAIIGHICEAIRPAGKQRLWLATGGGCNLARIFDEKRMQGRRITLFPDSDKVGDKWRLFAGSARLKGYDVTLVPVASFVPPEWLADGYDVGDYLTDIAAGRQRGSALADMIAENSAVGLLISELSLVVSQ